MLNEPLPCPFCGRLPAMIETQGEWGYTSDAIQIYCNKCEIRFRENVESWSPERGNFRTDKESAEKLLNKWNTRMGVPRHAE